MHKKTIIFLLSILLLSGCFGGDTTSDTTAGLTEYSQPGFSLFIPKTWDIQSDTLSFPQPTTGKIELSVVSNDEGASFARNLLVLSDTISKITTSKDFVISQMVSARDGYVEYSELDQQGITFADGEEGIVYVFEAKYNADTPLLKFVQTAHLCHPEDVYLMTITLPTYIREHAQYIDMLQTFSCDYVE